MEFYRHHSDYPMDQWAWPNFSPAEMASKREGELGIDRDAMTRLQRLRERLGRPIIITSAYRSDAHNRAVGGAKNSFHLRAKAFDIRMENHNPVEFEAAARAVGFTGFGYYPKSGFMHIDTGPARSWGNPFPQAESGLTMDGPRQPERLREDGVGAAAGGTVAAGAIGTIAEIAPQLAPAGSVIADLAPVAQIIAIGAVVLLAGYIVWKRF